MSWKLWIDDERDPPDNTWSVARSSCEASAYIGSPDMKPGFAPDWFPEHISFDHDLGGSDTVMLFLKWFELHYPNAIKHFEWNVHSENPVGRANIISFMTSWKNSRTLP